MLSRYMTVWTELFGLGRTLYQRCFKTSATINAATAFSFLSEYYKHILVKDQWNNLAVNRLNALHLHYSAAFGSYT